MRFVCWFPHPYPITFVILPPPPTTPAPHFTLPVYINIAHTPPHMPFVGLHYILNGPDRRSHLGSTFPFGLQLPPHILNITPLPHLVTHTPVIPHPHTHPHAFAFRVPPPRTCPQLHTTPRVTVCVYRDSYRFSSALRLRARHTRWFPAGRDILPPPLPHTRVAHTHLYCDAHFATRLPCSSRLPFVWFIGSCCYWFCRF